MRLDCRQPLSPHGGNRCPLMPRPLSALRVPSSGRQQPAGTGAGSRAHLSPGVPPRAASPKLPLTQGTPPFDPSAAARACPLSHPRPRIAGTVPGHPAASPLAVRPRPAVPPSASPACRRAHGHHAYTPLRTCGSTSRPPPSVVLYPPPFSPPPIGDCPPCLSRLL